MIHTVPAHPKCNGERDRHVQIQLACWTGTFSITNKLDRKLQKSLEKLRNTNLLSALRVLDALVTFPNSCLQVVDMCQDRFEMRATCLQ